MKTITKTKPETAETRYQCEGCLDDHYSVDTINTCPVCDKELCISCRSILGVVLDPIEYSIDRYGSLEFDTEPDTRNVNICSTCANTISDKQQTRLQVSYTTKVEKQIKDFNKTLKKLELEMILDTIRIVKSKDASNVKS